MIRYALTCAAEHGFDGWFRSSQDYDDQKKRGLLECPVCGSKAVDKALMAPAVSTREEAPAPALAEQPVALLDERAAKLREMLTELKAELTKNSKDVGDRFAEEARKIHYGESEESTIHGRTTPEEAKALIEEGIPVHPLPMLPEERN